MVQTNLLITIVCSRFSKIINYDFCTVNPIVKIYKFMIAAIFVCVKKILYSQIFIIAI